MTLSRTKRLLAVAGCAAALMAGASAAKADVVWLVSGTFDDGGAFSGFIDINVDGYLNLFNVATTAGSTEGAHDYNPSNSYIASGDTFVDLEPGYYNDLHLQFLDSLSTPSADNPIVGGEEGPSYECVASWSCFVPSGGTTRYVAEGFGATVTGDIADRLLSGGGVPEPAAWAMMLLGLGGVGGMMRRSRRAERALVRA